MRLLVLEKTGDKLSMVTNYMNLNKQEFCNRDGCFLCATSHEPTYRKCWVESITYQIDCQRCLKDGISAVYVGETGYSCYFRGKFDQDGLRNKHTDNPLYKHNLDCHPDVTLSWRDLK